MENNVKVNTPEKEVLLSVRNADVHFKVKRRIIKACNNVA